MQRLINVKCIEIHYVHLHEIVYSNVLRTFLVDEN